jgi:hypothetical protein
MHRLGAEHTVCALGEKENMANTVATPERATEWIAYLYQEKKRTPGKRLLAKQYREEFFTEYSAGEMPPEKKALITSILGFNFFAPSTGLSWSASR